MSLGSVYSLYRTMQKVDQLPLDVYKRAEFVLDSRVRVQRKEQGVETGDVEHGRREFMCRSYSAMWWISPLCQAISLRRRKKMALASHFWGDENKRRQTEVKGEVLVRSLSYDYCRPSPPCSCERCGGVTSTSSRCLRIQLESTNPADASVPQPLVLCRRPQLPGNIATSRLYILSGKVALGILGLRTHPSLAFLGLGGSSTEDEPGPADEDTGSIWEEDKEALEEEEEEEGGPWQPATTDGETDEEGQNDGGGGVDGDDDSSSTYTAAGAEAVRSTISKVGGDWTRFTQDVSEATEGLLAAVNKAGASVGEAADAVAEATSGVSGMSSEEVALTALLLKQLAAGGGPTPDQVLQLVQKCEREGTRPQKGVSRCSETMTSGDLIIPGNVRFSRACCSDCTLLVRGASLRLFLGTERFSVREPVGSSLGGAISFLVGLAVVVQAR